MMIPRPGYNGAVFHIQSDKVTRCASSGEVTEMRRYVILNKMREIEEVTQIPKSAITVTVKWCRVTKAMKLDKPISKALPSTPLSPLREPDPDWPVEADFARYCSGLPTWEQTLLRLVYIPKSFDGPTLLEILREGKKLTFCSDAATDVTKHSYYWVIAHGNWAVAEGGGIVPGHVINSNSGRSETVGALAATRFVLHLCQFHKIEPVTSKWKGFCDNLGLIQTVK